MPIINPPFPDNITKYISTLIHDYVTDPQEEAILARAPLADENGAIPSCPAWNDKLCFFESLDLRADALKKSLGHELISGNIPAAELLLAENPWLFDEVVSGVDHCSRRLTEKPIPFVARLCDFNPQQPEDEEKEEDFGAVERLSKIAIEKGRRTSDQIAVEVDEVLPCHWDTMTDERMEHYGLDPARWNELSKQHEFPWQAITEKHMQKYKDACEDLVKDIAAIDIPSDEDLMKDIPVIGTPSNRVLREIIWKQKLALPKVKDAALRFQNAIQSEGNEPPAGLLFDPAIFPWFIDRFWGKDGYPAWKDKLGDAWTHKIDFLNVLGYGGLIHNDTACGQQVHKKGICYVGREKNWQMPGRAVNYSEGIPASLALVGVSEDLDIYGEVASSVTREASFAWGTLAQDIYGTYAKQKHRAVTVCAGRRNIAQNRL